MIFAVFIVLILGVMVAFLNLLSDASFPNPTIDAITSSIHLVVGYMKSWNFIFAIDSLFLALGVVLTFEFITFVIQKIWTFLKFIRGANDA